MFRVLGRSSKSQNEDIVMHICDKLWIYEEIKHSQTVGELASVVGISLHFLMRF